MAVVLESESLELKFTKYPLEKLCLLITDGKHGDCINQPDSGFYFLSAKDVNNGKLNYENARQITENDFVQTHKRTQLEPNDILLTNSGTIGRLAIAKNNALTKHTTFQKSVALIKPNKEKVVPQWLYYYFAYSKEQLINFAGGTAQKNLLLRDLRAFPIHVPPIKAQKSIAGILSAYDDLIENNTRRITILEAMAQALYREWFVHFRYPGHGEVPLVDSPLGPIPQGWEVKAASLAIEVNPRTQVSKNALNPFVTMDSLSTNSMVIGEVTEKQGNSGSKFRNEDTLFARITPCLQNGKIGFVQFLPSEAQTACGSTEFIVLRSKTLTPEFVYLLARTEDFRNNAIQSMSGATGRQRVHVGCFDKYMLANPDPQTLETFSAITHSMFKQIHALSVKNKNLRQTRDLLLPRLISGQLDISELEIM